jgi:hypothetical protein
MICPHSSLPANSGDRPSLAMTSNKATYLVLALIGVGVVLRLAFLGADSLWLDEAYSVVAVLGHSTREAWETVLDRDHPPLFFVILRLTVLAFGASETTARLPSALASVCNLGLIFVLARRLGMTRRAGLTAVLLLALAPVDVWYAQEARMYALVTTAALLFAIGLAMESSAGAVLAAAALAAGLYTDFTMVPLSAALTAVWLVRWWHLGRPPWQLARVIVATSVAWWSYRPQWTHLWEILSRIDTVPLFVNLRESGIRLSPGLPAVAVVALIVFGTLIATAAMWNALGNRRLRTWWTWIAWAGFVGCTAAVMIPRAYSVKQFMSTGWPYVILAVAWSLTDGGREDARRSPAARLARLRLPLAVGLSLIAAIVTVAAPRADWRGLVAYLNARAAATEPGALSVWLDPEWNSTPYDYYRPKIAATAPLLSAESQVGRPAPVSDVCLVAERFGKPPPTSPSEAWLDNHFRLVDVVPFARLELRCYTNRGSIEEEPRRIGG